MRLRALVLALSLITGFVATASAQESVVILGLRTVEGDDSLALNVSQALRKAASEVPDWLVRDQSISLAQMVLVHGCESVDLPCLGTIATGLAVDRLIFGDLKHDSTTTDHNLQIELQMYSAKSGAIDGTASASFPVNPSPAVIDDLARQLLLQARPGATAGGAPMLTVSSNVEGAEVRLNGQLIGQIQGGSLRLPDLQPGAYTVELAAIGYQNVSKMVELAPGEATTLDLSLIPNDSGVSSADPRALQRAPAIDDDSGGSVLPYALFGVSALGIAGMVTSWIIIDNVGDKKIYKRYRAQIDTFEDVCVAAEQGHNALGAFSASEVNQVVDVCNTASTFEVLQYVFAGVAAVAAISGAALLVLDMNDGAETDPNAAAATARSLTVRPILGLNHGGLSAQLRF